MQRVCRRETMNCSLDSRDTYTLEPNEEMTERSELFSSVMSMEGHELRVDYRNAMVLHCALCHTVLSDSLEVCGEHEKLRFIICARVTKDVMVKEELEFQIQGPLAGCTYNALHCSGCHSFVGVLPNSTPKHVSRLRGLYLLHKQDINCYILKSSTMIKASEVTFEPGTIRNRLDELKQEMDGIIEHMFVIQRKLKGAYVSEDGK